MCQIHHLASYIFKDSQLHYNMAWIRVNSIVQTQVNQLQITIQVLQASLLLMSTITVLDQLTITATIKIKLKMNHNKMIVAVLQRK